MGYSGVAIKGFGWLGGLRLATRGLALVKFGLVASLLTPADFGLFGIVAMGIALFETLTETGVNMALIKHERWEKALSTSLVISVVRGFLICFLILLASWPVAVFFREPRVIPYLLLASLIPLIKGFINPAIISFQKQLAFHKESMFRAILLVLDVGVSLALVWWTRSVLGLVVGMLVSALVEVVLSWLVCKPRPSFSLDKAELRYILGFGKWLNVTVIANYLALQADNAVVGRMLGTEMLGIYQLGFKLAHDPVVEVSNVVAQASYPIYTKFQNDLQRVFRAFWRSLLLVLGLASVVIVPLVLAPSWVIGFFGKQWVGAIVVLPLLALAGGVRAMTSVSAPVFLAYSRTRILALISLVRLVGLLVLIPVLIGRWGLAGIALAVLLSNILAQPVMWWGMRRIRSKVAK